jgi:TolB-like protein
LSATLDQVYAFGDFTLDLNKGTLTRAGGEAFLRPKAHSLLAHLARNMGRVVPKSELMDTVWPDVYVTEDSLTQSIREIRKALGEGGQELIRTVSRRGYMLAGKSDAMPETTGQPIVAVLRFRNESGDPQREPVVDGFAEDIITGLAHYGSVTVLARNSSFQFPSYEPGAWADVAARIGADYLVEGSVRWSDDGAVIAVSLIDARHLQQLWGERYEAKDIEVFAVQREIGEQIVNRLVSRLDEVSIRRTALRPAASLAAYELVTRAASQMRGHDYHRPEGARDDLERAVEKDPSYGLAYSYLARVNLTIAGYGRAPLKVLQDILETAIRGTMLAPTQAVGPRVTSLIRIFMRQHTGAEADLRQALSLNHCDADSIEQMGFLLVLRGKPLEALDWIERAKRLNPIYPEWYHFDAGLALYGLAEYRAAADAFERPIRLPRWAEVHLAACYTQLGEMDRARGHIETARANYPNIDPLHDAQHFMPFEHQSDLDHLVEGIALAVKS